MFIDKLLSLAVGILFLLMISCDGPSEKKAVTFASQRTLKNDLAFWDYAASSNMLQVEISRLAINKDESKSVRALAENALRFHEDALKQLKVIASQHTDIQLPDSLAGADSNLVKEFEQLEGEEFISRYKAFIISTHKTQLASYQEALRKAEDQDIKDWINILLAHLRNELEQLNMLDTLSEESAL